MRFDCAKCRLSRLVGDACWCEKNRRASFSHEAALVVASQDWNGAFRAAAILPCEELGVAGEIMLDDMKIGPFEL